VPDFDVFDLNFKNMSHADFILFLGGMADALAVHPGYQTMPPEVPGSNKFRELETRYAELVKASQSKDVVKIAERDATRAEGVTAAKLTAHWAVIKSVAANDPSFLANLGLKVKKRASRAPKKIHMPAPTNVSVKHAGVSGSVVVKCSRVGGGASYEVRFCQGDPMQEESWTAGNGKHFAHCSDMQLADLEPGKIYHFQVRVLGNSGHGPWSTVVSLMVI
jgi:fibronectin type III domain protein